MTGRLRFPCAYLLLGLLVAGGCSGKPKLELVPVSGKVTVAGQALTSGQVSLHPSAKDQVIGGLCTGTIDSSGTFTIITDGKPGVPLGKYKITVTPSMVPPTGGAKGPPVSSIDRKYQDIAQTPLTFEVVANAEPGHYDLKLDK